MTGRRGRFKTREAMPANGVPLADEPVDLKAARMLRTLRQFVASPHGVTAIELDGQIVMLVKYSTERHPNADTTTDVSL